MRFRIALIILFTFLFTACNFSLAADVTPPPGYSSPTSAPEIGNLFPDEPPSPAQGAEFYVGNCAPCHGEDGLGNGPLASRLPVAVPAIGLREISKQITPADWYKIITLGNMERGMPPFLSFPLEDRWNVLAYTYTLNTTSEELQRGAELYAAYCSECHGLGGNVRPEVDFTNQEVLSKTTDFSLYRSIAEGKGEMKAFIGKLNEDDIWALTAYLRSLTFDMSSPELIPTPLSEGTATQTVISSATPEITPAISDEGIETPGPATIIVSGTVTNGTGENPESNLIATLVLYNTSDGEVFDSREIAVDVGGFYLFSDVYIDSHTAYWVSVDYQGVSYYSEIGIPDGSSSVITLPVIIFDATTNWLSLRFDLVHISMDILNKTLEVSELFVISNPDSKTVVIETDGTSLPFITLPEGVLELTNLTPDSRGASFLPAENGIALPPVADGQYGVVASFSVPYNRRFEFRQDFPMAITSMSLFVPEGVRIRGDLLTDSGTQDFSGNVFHLYEVSNLPVGIMDFVVTGVPSGTDGAGSVMRSWLVYGVGALGVIFIGLGVFLFLRERAAGRILEDKEEYKSSQTDLLDAIIALDEKLKNGEISAATHKKRRAELKKNLKEFLQE